MFRRLFLAAGALLAIACGCSPAPKVLSPMRLVTVVAANDPDQAALIQFGDALVGGSWWPAVSAEYGISAGARSEHVVGPPLSGKLDHAGLAAWLDAAIANGPKPDGNSVYLIYLPDGAELVDSTFEAFHAPLPGAQSGDAWAVVAQPHAYPGGETLLQAKTRLASHEVIESATDPTGSGLSFGETPAQPWTEDIWRSYERRGEVEVGDRCEGTRIELSGWEYQRSWSATAAARGGDPCVPAAAEPYFTVAATRDWYPVAPGTTQAISVQGQASGPRADWLLGATLINSSGAFHDAGTPLTVASDVGASALAPGCGAFPRVRDGSSASLSVTVPAGAARGDWAVYSLCSFEEDPTTCYPPAGQDVCHLSLVGVYVP